MPNERLVFCGGAVRTDVQPGLDNLLRLDLRENPNVFVLMRDISRELWKEVPAAFQDLIEVAAYVYAADQAVTRGGATGRSYGEKWRRHFRFAIPVREVGLWRSADVHDALADVLALLSEDRFDFCFHRLVTPGPPEALLGFKGGRFDGAVDDVALFSGGLDSLAGAAQEALSFRRKLLLVHHRSTQKLTPVLRGLVREIRHRADPPARPYFLPVRVHKSKRLSREDTQRTRSFLFAALAATVARMVGRDRILVFENGVTSMNLPLASQIVGARASRTTHPLVLRGFARLFTALLGRQFQVVDPFRRLTKAEVVRVLADGGGADLIGRSRSCAKPHLSSNDQPHCGVCSQCLDRRVAVLAAGVAAHDPATGYRVELFTGGRPRDEDQLMAAVYFEHARRIAAMSPPEFFGRYGEAARVLAASEGAAAAAAQEVYELHRRHSEQVRRVLAAGLSEHSAAIMDRTLPVTSLLRMLNSAPVTSAPARSAQETSLPANVFRRDGQTWEFRFQGGEVHHLPNSVGLEHLHKLLGNPGRVYSAWEMAGGDSAQSGVQAPRDAGEAMDKSYQQEVLKQVSILSEAVNEAKANGNELEAQEHQAELTALISRIQADTSLNGRSRRVGDVSNRVRSQVTMAIRRAIEKIATRDGLLAKHLQSARHLRCGRQLCYTPRKGMCWETSPRA